MSIGKFNFGALKAADQFAAWIFFAFSRKSFLKYFTQLNCRKPTWLVVEIIFMGLRAKLSWSSILIAMIFPRYNTTTVLVIKWLKLSVFLDAFHAPLRKSSNSNFRQGLRKHRKERIQFKTWSLRPLRIMTFYLITFEPHHVIFPSNILVVVRNTLFHLAFASVQCLFKRNVD